MAFKYAEFNSENAILFACTRRSLLDTHRQMLHEISVNRKIDWDTIYSTAELHQVTPLVYSNLLECIDVGLEIPNGTLVQFKNSVERRNAMKKAMLDKLTESLSFLNNRSIDVMAIKITIKDLDIDRLYAPSNDIDLVTRKRREEISDQENVEIKRFLRSLGRNQHGHLIIEFDYFEHHDMTMFGVLSIDFREIWERAIKFNFRGQDVFLMSPEDLLLSVCINSRRKRYFRLKSLYEIAELVRENGNLDWDVFAKRARKYRCNSIVYTALLTTKMTIGCELPSGSLESLGVSSWRAKAIQYLILFFSQRVPLHTTHPYNDPIIRVFGTNINLGAIIMHSIYLPQFIRYLINQRLTLREMISNTSD